VKPESFDSHDRWGRAILTLTKSESYTFAAFPTQPSCHPV